jgi:hypothetical protein
MKFSYTTYEVVIKSKISVEFKTIQISTGSVSFSGTNIRKYLDLREHPVSYS